MKNTKTTFISSCGRGIYALPAALGLFVSAELPLRDFQHVSPRLIDLLNKKHFPHSKVFEAP